MKLSYNWLKDYVNVKASPEELARILTMSGSKVEGIAKVGDDHVLELEITANRPDCLNIIGLARELSAVLGEELKLPEQNIGKSMPDDKNSVRIECIVEAPELCPQYTARIITGVKVKKSSAKIAARIMALGMREINNVADITNYCLHELGQPMHAFDLDKIKGGKIIVREARDGEKIVTIDGVERELKKGMLVIADVERPVAIAGIMGGIDTEVSEKTKNVLLESAYFNLLSIRRTGRKLVLSTDASYRYERGVDRGMIIPASERAAAMIMGEAGGNVGGFYNVGDCRSKKMSIDFDPNKINTTLGIDIDKKEVKGILVRLGMEVSDKTDGRFTVGVPSFREDIKLRVDLMEEIARIYGYENIPARIPEISPAVIRKEKPRQVKEKITEVLVSLGMNEIMTYSLVNESVVKRFAAISVSPVTLMNPLSEDQRVMTPHLLDGMLKSISWNINRGTCDLRFFEIGKKYSVIEDARQYREIPALCVGFTGFIRNNWAEGKRAVTFFDVKGVIEALFASLRLVPKFKQSLVEGILAPSAVISVDGEDVGFIGEVTGKVLKDYGVEQPVFVSEIKLDRLYEKASLMDMYKALSKFPFSSRDMSILCDKTVTAADMYDVILVAGTELVKDIRLVDVYEGDKIPSGKKSLTYSVTYGLDNRTLNDAEVESMHARIKSALSEKLGVTFR